MTHIFIEAKSPKTSEYVFIKTLLEFMGYSNDDFDINCVNGKDNLHNTTLLKQNTVLGEQNLIIFDADTFETNGGFGKRFSEIDATLEGMNVEAEVFLFPNNHDDGIFENLLLDIAQKEIHKQFFDCYADYEACLGNNYITPNLKGKVFTYISAQKSLSNSQRKKLSNTGEWFFNNEDFWDLNAEALIPLKDFLRKNISQIVN